MILFKHISKYILLVILLFNIGCSSESSDEEQLPDETVIEDFTNLKDDPKFLEYIEQSIIFSFRIANPNIILELHQKTDLTDQENLQLAQALGFDTIALMEDNYGGLVEKWITLYNRFDLGNQSMEEVNEIINDVYLKTFILVEDKRETHSKDDIPRVLSVPGWCNNICTPPYRETIRRNDRKYSAMVDECYDIEGDGKDFKKCMARAKQIVNALDNKAYGDLRCCLIWTCEILSEDRECGNVIPVS